MQKAKYQIVFLILLLAIISLACNWFGKKAESSEIIPTPGQTMESTPLAEATPSAIETLQENSSLKSGSLYRSEVGGYAFEPISDYKMDEFFGLASLVAPDADPDLGPMIMLIGGVNDTATTEEEIFGEFIKDAEGEDINILDQKEITVGGKPGILADIGGEVNGQRVTGRIVVVAVSPTQQFTMFASAPESRWEELKTEFDMVLASVFFFEPQEIDFSEGIDE